MPCILFTKCTADANLRTKLTDLIRLNVSTHDLLKLRHANAFVCAWLAARHPRLARDKPEELYNTTLAIRQHRVTGTDKIAHLESYAKPSVGDSGGVILHPRRAGSRKNLDPHEHVTL